MKSATVHVAIIEHKHPVCWAHRGDIDGIFEKPRCYWSQYTASGNIQWWKWNPYFQETSRNWGRPNLLQLCLQRRILHTWSQETRRNWGQPILGLKRMITHTRVCNGGAVKHQQATQKLCRSLDSVHSSTDPITAQSRSQFTCNCSGVLKSFRKHPLRCVYSIGICLWTNP